MIVARLSVALFLLSATHAGAVERYLCIGDAATGFSWSGSGWVQTKFKVADSKFIIQPLTPDEQLRWKREGELGLTNIGDNSPSSFCKQNGDTIECDFVWRTSINTKTLRFLAVYPEGYTDGSDNNENTPGMTIGKCSRF